MMEGVAHAQIVMWSRCKLNSNLQRLSLHVKLEKLVVEKIGRLLPLTLCRQEGQRMKGSEEGCFLIGRRSQLKGL